MESLLAGYVKAVLIGAAKSLPFQGIRKRFARGIRNPGLWNTEYSSRNPESH